MKLPSKFQIMRRNRQTQRRAESIVRLREEAQALGYDDSVMVIDALQELDARRYLEDRPAPRRWWHRMFSIRAAR